MVNTNFSTPTLAELIDQAEANFNARLPGADSRLRNSVLNVLARTISGQTLLGFKYLDWVARQAIPDTADAENLDNWGRVWGIIRTAATKAAGSVTFTGTNGITVPTGTQVQRADGVTYTTTADATIAVGSASASVLADEVGEDGNASASTGVTLVSPISGVNSTAVVAAGGLAGGEDIESDDGYRARILARIQQPPHGGAKSDYVQWALANAGVTRAWCTPLEMGLGTVMVRFVKDLNTDPVPQNLAAYSEDFGNAAWVKTAATVSAGGATHPSSAAAYSITPTGSNAYVRQLVPIWQTGTFTFAVDVYGLGGARTFDLQVYAADGTTLLNNASVTAPSGAWATLSINAVVASGSAVYVQIGGSSTLSTGETIVVTRAHMRHSSADAAYVSTASDTIVGSLMIPTAADVEAVLDYIAAPTRAPVTADVYVAAPIAKRLDITVTGLNPNTTAVKQAVISELEDLIARDSEPGGTIRVSRIWEAVSIATGESYHTITSPSTDQVAASGRMWVLGAVTFA